jgi:hypothetical protein
MSLPPSVPTRAVSIDPDILRRLFEAALPADIDLVLGPQPTGVVAVTPADRRVQKVIVAVHGIGDQARNETVLATAIRFCDCYRYDGGIPLGAFEPGPGSRPGLVIPAPPRARDLTGVMAFVEAHWADIPRRIARDGYTLQETKAWARAIVARLRALATLRSPVNAGIDYRRIRMVLEEMIEAIGVLEALLFLAKKAGLGEFNLKALLDDYLGDVQLVTEFAAVRARIISRFANTLAAVAEKYPAAQLYIVAHSEGTVVSFLGLLEAIDRPRSHAWIGRVAGFMTLGSPIDKHLILWPELFVRHKGPPDPHIASIRWRNYVDYADPVGFDLDTARRWLEDRGYDRVFHFTAGDDYAFRRYPVPGKAHVDYWNDSEVFAHFIDDVVRAPTEPLIEIPYAAGVGPLAAAAMPAPPAKAPPPESKKVTPYLALGLGYLLPIVLIHIAAYILVASIGAYFDPKGEAKHPNLIPTVLGVAWLVTGTTLWLRIVRLTRTWWWFGGGLLCYVIGGAGYLWMVARIDLNAPVNELAWIERLSLLAKLPLGVTGFALSLTTIFFVLIFSLPRLRPKPGRT